MVITAAQLLNITGSCGDSLIQLNESCDDGAVLLGDGCNVCAIEPYFACGDSAPQVVSVWFLLMPPLRASQG